jgi:hypothetical protein
MNAATNVHACQALVHRLWRALLGLGSLAVVTAADIGRTRLLVIEE